MVYEVQPPFCNQLQTSVEPIPRYFTGFNLTYEVYLFSDPRFILLCLFHATMSAFFELTNYSIKNP
jgi:hypothetical protein